ncbi:MAG: hypothetical protein AAFO91_05085, partial [Bacteroidota bacterium]
ERYIEAVQSQAAFLQEAEQGGDKNKKNDGVVLTYPSVELPLDSNKDYERRYRAWFKAIRVVMFYDKNNNILNRNNLQMDYNREASYLFNINDPYIQDYVETSLYCFRLEDEDVQENYTNPDYKQAVKVRRAKLYFVNLYGVGTFQSVFTKDLPIRMTDEKRRDDTGGLLESDYLILTITERFKIMSHLIKFIKYSRSKGKYLCSLSSFNFLLVQNKYKPTFKMIDSKTNRPVSFQILFSSPKAFINLDQTCQNRTDLLNTSPYGFVKQYKNDRGEQVLGFQDNYGLLYSFVMMLLSVETDFRFYLKNSAAIVNQFAIRNMQTLEKEGKQYVSMYDRYHQQQEQIDAVDQEFTKEKFDHYMNYNVNRITLYDSIRKYIQLPYSVIGDKNLFLQSILTRSPRFNKKKSFIGHVFMVNLYFQVFYTEVQNSISSGTERYLDKFEKKFIELYEEVYPKQALQYPKDPNLVFTEIVLNQMIQYILTEKFSLLMIKIYFNNIMRLYGQYKNPAYMDTHDFKELDSMILEYELAEKFLNKEVPKMDRRLFVDSVFQMRNGTIHIRGYDSFRVIVLSQKGKAGSRSLIGL